jgi:hypothetical protein
MAQNFLSPRYTSLGVLFLRAPMGPFGIIETKVAIKVLFCVPHIPVFLEIDFFVFDRSP